MSRIYGIDLDGVSFDFVGLFSDWLKTRLNISYDDKDIVEYHWYKCIPGLSQEDFFREFDKFGYAGMYSKLKTLPGASDAIKKLMNKGKVWFVTARPSYAEKCTIQAVKREFGADRKQIVFSRGLDYKSSAVSLLGIDTFIEDGPHYAMSIAEKTNALVYLMDMPYNREISHQKILRVSSWSDILAEEGLS